MNWTTHAITNQVPELKDYDLYASDPGLRRAVERAGAGWSEAELARQGALLGAEDTIRHAEDANRHHPELHTHSRAGERIDQVRFHPGWHAIMAIARASGLANLPFADTRPSPRAGSARVVLVRTSEPPCFSVMPMPTLIDGLSPSGMSRGS